MINLHTRVVLPLDYTSKLDQGAPNTVEIVRVERGYGVVHQIRQDLRKSSHTRKRPLAPPSTGAIRPKSRASVVVAEDPHPNEKAIRQERPEKGLY